MILWFIEAFADLAHWARTDGVCLIWGHKLKRIDHLDPEALCPRCQKYPWY